jgi:hypothetical protein
LGFHPGCKRKEGRVIYIRVASKEEYDVQDVADAMTATADQRFLPARAPGTGTPTTPNTDEDARFHDLGVGATRKPVSVFISDTGSTGQPL